MPKVPKIIKLYIFAISLEKHGDKVHVKRVKGHLKVHDHFKVHDPVMFVVTCFIKEFIESLPECSFDKYCGLIFSDAPFVSIITISAGIATLLLIILSQIVSMFI